VSRRAAFDAPVIGRDLVDGVEYPPSRTGMRGSHPGSYDVAHAIRDGERFELDGVPVDEEVEVVVVGAGMSAGADRSASRRLRSCRWSQSGFTAGR